MQDQKSNDEILTDVRTQLKDKGVDEATADNIVSIMAADPIFCSRGAAAILEKNLAKAIAETTGGLGVTLSMGFTNDLTDQIRQERNLTQFLGLSLRAVLPYAEAEASQIAEVGRRDSDATARQEGRDAERAVTRAQAALRELQASELTIDEMKDDDLDEDFQVIFSENEDE